VPTARPTNSGAPDFRKFLFFFAPSRQVSSATPHRSSIISDRRKPGVRTVFQPLRHSLTCREGHIVLIPRRIGLCLSLKLPLGGQDTKRQRNESIKDVRTSSSMRRGHRRIRFPPNGEPQCKRAYVRRTLP